AVEYGYGGGKNAVNTFDQSVTKDLIAKGTATIDDFSFSDREKKNIYEKMRNANVMADKDLDVERGCDEVHYKSFKIKVQVNEKSQEHEWSGKHCGYTNDGKELKNVVEFIDNIVKQKNVYKEL